MNSKAIPLHILSLVAVAAGCGQQVDDINSDGPEDTRARVHSVELAQLAIVSDDAPSVNHPIRVDVGVDVVGDEFSGDLLVGLTDGEGAGCILGAMELVHPGGTSQATIGGEFFVDADCAPLIDSADVEVFAAFDPWVELSFAGRADASHATSMFEAVVAQALDAGDCDSCEVATTVEPSPGLDAQLRELGLDSSVAVLDVPAEPGSVVAGTHASPHFAVSNRLRVAGLGKGQTVGGDGVALRYRIRPLPGTDAHGELGSSAQDFMVLTSMRDGEFREMDILDATGQIDHNGAAALYIADEVRAMMTGGAWADIEQFELETCAVTNFDEAIFSGEGQARDNNCGVLPVVVARRVVDAGGAPVASGAEQAVGSANSRSADVWSTGWSMSNGSLGTTGFDFSTWIDVNSSDSASTTHGGRTVAFAGSWFEAGALATGTVFDEAATLADIYGSFIAYNGGGGAVYMGATLLGYDFLSPIAINTVDGITLSLQDILDIANSNASPVFERNVSIVGFSFDDGCGSVNAGIWANGQIGIDTEETTITVQVTPGMAKVTGVFNPYASAAAVAGTTVNYGDFLSGSLTATVDLVRADVPFTASAQLNHTNGNPQSLILSQSADLVLSALSGKITFSTKWKDCFIWCWEVDHDHDLVTWDGVSNTYPLFALSQTISLGGEVAWPVGANKSHGAGITSGDGGTALVMQGDGNLVVYSGGAAVWASNTAGHHGAVAVFQGDGNLVIYSGGVPIWASNTSGNPGATLAVDNSGRFQIRNAGGTTIYSS